MEDFNDFDNGLGFNTGFDVAIEGVLAHAEPAVSAYDVPAEVDTGSVWDEEVNFEEQEKIAKAAMPPGGYYDVQGLDEYESTRDKEVVLKTPEGLRKVKVTRQGVRLKGRGVREVEGKVYQPYLSITVCPSVAYGVDENGQPTETKLASDYKLYSALQKAYITANQIDTKTARVKPREVIAWARTAPLKFRTFQGSDSLVVLDIVPVLG